MVRIFGTDQQLATDSLWAILRTIGVMQDYMRHGIENHPAISAEYVRFLVTNSSLGSVARFDHDLKDLQEQMSNVATRA